MDDGESGPKISSLSGANRKRKWDEAEEEQNGEESSDLGSSSDDDVGDSNDGGNDSTEARESKEALSSCLETEDKQDGGEEEQVVNDSQKVEKKEAPAAQLKVPSKMPCQPAVFIPVDRLPEIQVCAFYLYFFHLHVCLSWRTCPKMCMYLYGYICTFIEPNWWKIFV